MVESLSHKQTYDCSTQSRPIFFEACPNLEFSDHFEDECPYECFDGEVLAVEHEVEIGDLAFQDALFGYIEDPPEPDEAECAFAAWIEAGAYKTSSSG